jgi:hypothetical protein
MMDTQTEQKTYSFNIKRGKSYTAVQETGYNKYRSSDV